VTEVRMMEEEEEEVYGAAPTPLPRIPLLVTPRLVLLRVRENLAKISE